MSQVRTNWTREEVAQLYGMPLIELMFQAATTHRRFHDPRKMQLCTLLSVKTGGCPEDCGYCSQSSRYQTFIRPQPLMKVEEVVEKARRAKEAGATRFCMGAAWRSVREGKAFDTVLEMVREVSAMGLQACCTLGMLSLDQAKRLKEAGLYAYNHNLDTSRAHYPKVTTTRTYDERLATLKAVAEAGITICCGGILGLGESEDDRIDLLHTLATLPVHPASVPINVLAPVEGTPMYNQPPVPIWEFVRVAACARLLMPASRVRFSAGRHSFTAAEQALCFLVGVNAIWSGDKLLTMPNRDQHDEDLLQALGMEALTMEDELLDCRTESCVG